METKPSLLESIERSDCTVRAIANAYDVPYEKAHEICERYGRKFGTDFHFQAKLATELGLKILDEYFNVRVSKLPLRKLTGTYLCLVDSHIFCIKGSKVLDSVDSGRKRVIRLYEVSK